MLEVEPITLGRMIDRLEEAGLVERRRDPADRRAWRIHLTPKAGPVLARLHVIADEMFDSALIDLSDTARAELLRSLGKIRERLLEETVELEAAHG